MVQVRNHKILNLKLMLYFESTGDFRKNEPNLSGYKIAQDTPRSIIKDNYSSSNGPTMNIICKTHPITNNRYYVLSGTIQDEIISYILVTCLCSCTHDNFSSWKGLSSTDLMFQVIRT